MKDSLITYQASRAALLAEITQTIAADERFVAAWLTASYGRNKADALSDLDLTLVVAGAHSERLCTRRAQVSGQTTEERLALFSQFGQPAVLHENNYNAPEEGTFTFVLYAPSAVMVDWILLPQNKARCPAQARLLFDKVGIPPAPLAEPESVAQRIEKATEIVAFFWMMTAVTAKYLVRRDNVFVQCWLEEQHGLVREVERLITGKPRAYQRGSLSKFQPTSAGQKQAIYQLYEQMQRLMSQLAELDGSVRSSPMPVIELLLGLADDV